MAISDVISTQNTSSSKRSICLLNVKNIFQSNELTKKKTHHGLNINKAGTMLIIFEYYYQ